METASIDHDRGKQNSSISPRVTGGSQCLRLEREVLGQSKDLNPRRPGSFSWLAALSGALLHDEGAGPGASPRGIFSGQNTVTHSVPPSLSGHQSLNSKGSERNGAGIIEHIL